MTDKIAIFYHVGQMNDWQDVYAEQLRKLQESGLYDATQFIFCGINGEEPFAGPSKMVGVRNANQGMEADTIRHLWSFASNNPDYKMLYFHTKGVSWHGSEIYKNVTGWRRFMELYTIGKWKDCIAALDTHDICGVLLEQKATYNTGTLDQIELEYPHYAGNFWWANSNYIAKLNPDYLYVDDTPFFRGKSEIWIGTGNPKAHSLRNLNYINPYFHDYGEANEYR